MPYSSFLGVSSFICFIVYFLSRLVFCFIVDLPADSFFIAKADFFECGGEEGGGSVCLLFCPDCYYSGSEFRVPNIVKRKQE